MAMAIAMAMPMAMTMAIAMGHRHDQRPEIGHLKKKITVPYGPTDHSHRSPAPDRTIYGQYGTDHQTPMAMAVAMAMATLEDKRRVKKKWPKSSF